LFLLLPARVAGFRKAISMPCDEFWLSWTPAVTPTLTQNIARQFISFQIPHSLYREDGYDHREALFGMPAYGGSLALPVYYTKDQLLCDDKAASKKNFFPARKDDEMDPFILMIDRGGCTFVQKVRKAQQSGASAVVVADNVCQCSDADCKRKSGSALCESQEPIMAGTWVAMFII
jgi:PA domain